MAAKLHRHRVPTPRHDYDGTVRAIKEGVERIEQELASQRDSRRGHSRHNFRDNAHGEERQLRVDERQAV